MVLEEVEKRGSTGLRYISLLTVFAKFCKLPSDIGWQNWVKPPISIFKNTITRHTLINKLNSREIYYNNNNKNSPRIKETIWLLFVLVWWFYVAHMVIIWEPYLQGSRHWSVPRWSCMVGKNNDSLITSLYVTYKCVVN